MYLTFEQVKDAVRGAVRVEEQEGKIAFYRFSESEQEVYRLYGRKAEFYPKTFHTSSIRLAFTTNSSYLAFDFFQGEFPVKARVTMDVYEDDSIIQSISLDFRCMPEGRLHIPLQAKETRVEIYFPFNCPLRISNVELEDGASFASYRRPYKVLTLGDSITHGSSAGYPSLSYAAHLARLLKADFINKGIGGEHFFPELLTAPEAETPDWITVAYGTNDWKHCTREELCEHAGEVMRKLTEFYPGRPIFVISPLWRADYKQETPFGAPTDQVHEALCGVAAEFPDVTVIHGWNLVPHEKHFFADSRLHPNDLGFGIYAANLYREMIPHLIEKIGYSFHQ